MWLIIALFICTFVNVVLSTLKSVITIKGGKLAAAITTTLAYAFNTVVVKLVANVDLWLAIIVSVICNLLGVYIGLIITDKMRKEQLWKITVSVPTDVLHQFKADLTKEHIKFMTYQTSWELYKVVDIFSSTKEESKHIRNIIKKYDVKYTISANDGIL